LLVVVQVTFYLQGNMAVLLRLTLFLPIAGAIFNEPCPWVF
jgi:hypothetical protein